MGPDIAEEVLTSIRQIVKEAGVNVASLHYHFGSKEAVIHQIITRRLQPINRQKVKRLDELERESNGKSPDLEAILRAFIEPHIQMQKMDANKVKILMKLMVQIEDDAHKLNGCNREDTAGSVRPGREMFPGILRWNNTPSHRHRYASAIRPDAANLS